MNTTKYGRREIPAHECNCVTPDQSCPACRDTARKVYGKEFDEPMTFAGWLKEYRNWRLHEEETRNK